MTFEKGIKYLICEMFLNNNPGAKITDSDVELYLSNKCNDDCSNSIYLIVDEGDYIYDIYMFNYNPFVNPWTVDKRDMNKQLKEFFEKQYLFAAGDWEII